MKLLKFVYFFSCFFIFLGCVKTDEYIDWKLLNDEWFEGRKLDKVAFPFNWQVKSLGSTMIDTAFMTSESGVRFRRLRPGNPSDRKPNPTSYIWAIYEKKLIDGTTFELDSIGGLLGSLPDLEKGIQEGLLKMHIGQTCEFYIPWEQTLNSSGKQVNFSIPKYSVIICRIQLTDVKL